jgi:hypothetical protein
MQKDFLCPKKQNAPAETGAHFSTRPSVSHYYVLSRKIFRNRKLFCYSSVFSDIGQSESRLDLRSQAQPEP